MNKDLCANMLSKKGLGGLTRRGWLQGTSLIVAVGAFSRLTVRASTEISPVMDKLSTYMTEARHRELPVKGLQETEHHILDIVAAMVSGSDLLPGREAIKFARNYGGEKIATVVASKVLCGPIEAALANGQLAHSDESDDDYTAGGAHPGCAVVPAALAVGEQFGISGTHFMRAGVCQTIVNCLQFGQLGMRLPIYREASAKFQRSAARSDVGLFKDSVPARRWRTALPFHLAGGTLLLVKRYAIKTKNIYLMGPATVGRPRSSLSMAAAIARTARALGCRSQGSRHDESISTKT
jgi:hypothetical protein